jgi:mono/diheme cytochrome c family protein
MTQPSFLRKLGWPGLLVLVLLVVVAAVFLFEMVTFNAAPAGEQEVMSAADVDALLASADPARGEELSVAQTCATCHVQGAANGIAPPFEGISQRAASRVPDMPASVYLYDSIVHPTDYLVEGYAPSMPQDYGSRMTPQEIADIVAYLLTQ